MSADTSSNAQFTVIRDVCERLDRAGVKYMITGSLALCYFAEPRFTRDLDIVVDLEPGEAGAFARLFEPDYYLSEDAVRGAIATRGIVNALHLREAFKVDFVVRKRTAFHQTEFTRRSRVDYNGIETWMISKEDLIIAKLNWARESFSELQLRDINKLMETGYDADYVSKWVATLGLAPVFEKAKSHE